MNSDEAFEEATKNKILSKDELTYLYLECLRGEKTTMKIYNLFIQNNKEGIENRQEYLG